MGGGYFVKKHPTLEFNENFGRNHVLRADINGSVKKALGW